MIIPFNKPPYTGNEDKHVLNALHSQNLSGDGEFGKLCQMWFEKQMGVARALLTPNCTQALEMAAILIDVQPGDEIIMPSYTFVSTANAFVLRGAKIIFVDIRPDTMNIDESLIEAAITHKTKAIVPVHYAGVGCEMDTIMDIASRHDLFVIEDAAQGVHSTYHGKSLGSIGHLAAYSFHETKNYTSGGEGGLLIANDASFTVRAEIIREKGTNRSQFFRGMVDKYSWVDIGSSYLPSELQAAYLWGQLEKYDEILASRMRCWLRYKEQLLPLESKGLISTPRIPEGCTHNAHMFYIKVLDLDQRTAMLNYLKSHGVQAAFHYIPLHSATAGTKFGRFYGQDRFTTVESERLLRLPIWYGMTRDEQEVVIQSLFGFFN